jgi:uncharacterized membrane protein
MGASIGDDMAANERPTDLLLIVFEGVNSAAEAYASARRRSGTASRWPDQAGLVEHYEHGHVALRGVFAGHYVDADERMHASEAGAAEGWRTGALAGLLLGPPGFAVGNVLGALVGSQEHDTGETDAEPTLVADKVRTTVPAPGSAIVLVADPGTCDEMLGAFDLGAATVTRRTLSRADLEVLEISLRDTPPAPSAPRGPGEAAVARVDPSAQHAGS